MNIIDKQLLHSSLWYSYLNSPHATAVIDKEHHYSYEDLWMMIVNMAHWINQKFGQGVFLGVMLNNSIEAVVCMYSISLSGNACVPLDVDITEIAIKYIVDDASISAIFTNIDYMKNLQGFLTGDDLPVVDVGGGGTDSKLVYTLNKEIVVYELSLPDIKTKDTAVILYTSGTTGMKKGVELSHENLRASTENINSVIKVGAWAIESLPMRLTHSFGFGRLRCILNVGGTVILENGFLCPQRILFNMRKFSVNGISSTPAGFAILLNYFRDELREIASHIRYIEIGSDAMAVNHKKLLMDLCPGASIYMHYGLTEASRSAFIEF